MSSGTRRRDVISVTLRPEDDEVLLVVEDDGAGLDPERLGERLADGHIGLASQRVGSSLPAGG